MDTQGHQPTGPSHTRPEAEPLDAPALALHEPPCRARMIPLARAMLDALRDDPEARAELRTLLAPHTPPPASEPDGWLNTEAAAAYAGLKRQRIYDLKSSSALPPDGYDGRTPLWRRETLDAYLRGRLP